MSLAAKTVTGATYEKIKSDIISGEYRPGQRLLEKELTETLEVSRTPIRDALVRLQEEGLVIIKPHRGVFVRKLTRKDIQDHYQTRAVLEGLGAKLAAINVTDDGKDIFRNFVVKMETILATEAKVKGFKSIAEVNDEFHSYIFSVADNAVLDKMRRTLASPIALIRSTSWINQERKHEVYQEHLEITEAIINQIPLLAQERAEAHIYKAWKSAEFNLDQLPIEEGEI
ncbi:GntR family transcriptional regulator [Metabacillus herbersteinensis]|uniref:GntR family transcriptional regulator n=1 Tax=Metabacillus herbersteinensis TaxID=283816 RepID=A0ABV6GB95_9BACI